MIFLLVILSVILLLNLVVSLILRHLEVIMSVILLLNLVFSLILRHLGVQSWPKIAKLLGLRSKSGGFTPPPARFSLCENYKRPFLLYGLYPSKVWDLPHHQENDPMMWESSFETYPYETFLFMTCKLTMLWTLDKQAKIFLRAKNNLFEKYRHEQRIWAYKDMNKLTTQLKSSSQPNSKKEQIFSSI